MSKVNNVRGMHDIFGKEYQKQKYITDIFTLLLESHNYVPVSTPILEYSEVFKRTLGAGSDVVMKEMYTFEDKSKDYLTLRPEGTASIARAIISNGLTQKLPLKFYYFGPMFRYERPQKGRYREFNQLGIEFFGNGKIYEDWETIYLAFKLLKKLKIEKELVLRINTLGSSKERHNYIEEIKKYFTLNLSNLSPDSRKRLERNPLRILDSKDQNDIELIKNAPVIYDFLNNEDLDSFTQLKEMLRKFDIKFNEDPFLVRGLDYYNGTTFEFTIKNNKNFTVLAGGRYNNLVNELGGNKVPGIGWAAGIERLISLCNINIEEKKIIVIAPLNKKYLNFSLQIFEQLFSSDLKLEMSYLFDLKKCLSFSNKIKASHIIIVGETEANNLKPSIKNLANGKQVSLDVNQLSSYIKNE